MNKNKTSYLAIILHQSLCLELEIHQKMSINRDINKRSQ